MTHKKFIIIIVLVNVLAGLITGYLISYFFKKPQIIEKIVLKPIDNSWKTKDSVIASLKRADSIKISKLNNTIKERESRLERLKMILLKDTTKTSLEADSIIHAQDSTINDLGDEAELYSSQLYKANRQISIRDSVILDREKTIKDYSDLIHTQGKMIGKQEEEIKKQNFIKTVLGVASGVLLITTIIK